MLVITPRTYADKFGHFECSGNFWQLFCLDLFWLVFDFCLFSYGNKKSHRGPDLKNTVAAATLLCCFWPKIRAQAMSMSRGVIMVLNSIFVLPQIREFLTDCFAQITHNLQVIFLIDHSILKIWYRSFDPVFGIGKNWRRTETCPSKIAVKN